MAANPPQSDGRRGFVVSLLMGAGLLAGYGLGAWHFLRYLVPLKATRTRREMFVGTLKSIPVGASLTVKDPAGQEIAIARTGTDAQDPARGFKALSSKCPHLGCKVHFSPGDQQFLCPCHQGVFDKNGKAVSGPPAKENKNLLTYDVKVNPATGCVFVMVSAEAAYHG
ncbi:MAG: ubiquinol-cytochrome c reductase iron-sulfur subunit [Phycisphaerae bacterium]